MPLIGKPKEVMISQMNTSPIDIQYTNKGVWFTASSETTVDPTNHPQKELRVKVFSQSIPSTDGLTKHNKNS